MATRTLGIQVAILGVVQAGRELDKLNNRIETSASRVSGFRARVGGLGASVNQIGLGLSKFGAIMSIGVTLPIIAATTAAINAGISFESAFAGISKTVDGVADATGELTGFGQELREQFRGLAQDVPIALNELASIGEIGGQLGIPKDQLLGFTETIALLGVATNLSTEQAALGFARLGNIVGVQSEDMAEFVSRAGNAVVDLGNNFAAQESEILGISLRLAGISAQANVTSADILGLSTAMAALGIRAEMGGSVVTRIFTEMGVAMSQGTEEGQAFARVIQKGFGDTGVNALQAFEDDATSAFVAWLDGLKAISDEGGNFTTALDDMGLSGVRVRDVVGRLIGDTDTLKDALRQSAIAWDEQTALQLEATKRFATTQSQIQFLKNALFDLGITIFDKVREPLRLVIESLTDFIRGLKNLDPVLLNIGLLFGGFILLLGPVIALIGILVSVVGALVGALASMSAIAVPVGLALGGIVVALGALGLELAGRPDTTFLEEIIGIADRVQARVQTISDKIKDIRTFLAGPTEDDLAAGERQFGGTGAGAEEQTSGTTRFEIAEENLGPLADDLSSVRDRLREIVSVIEQGKIGETFSEQLGMITTSTVEYLANSDTLGKSAVTILGQLFGGEFIRKQAQLFRLTFLDVKLMLTGALDEIKLAIEDVSTVFGIGSTKANDFGTGLQAIAFIIGGVLRIVLALAATVLRVSLVILAGLIELAARGLRITVGFWARILAAGVNALVSIGDSIKNNTYVGDAMQEFAQKLIEPFVFLKDEVVSIANDLLDILVGNSIFPDIMQGIIDTFTELPSKVGGLFQSMSDEVVRVAEGLVTKAKTIGGDIISALMGGASDEQGEGGGGLGALVGGLFGGGEGEEEEGGGLGGGFQDGKLAAEEFFTFVQEQIPVLKESLNLLSQLITEKFVAAFTAAGVSVGILQSAMEQAEAVMIASIDNIESEGIDMGVKFVGVLDDITGGFNKAKKATDVFLIAVQLLVSGSFEALSMLIAQINAVTEAWQAMEIRITGSPKLKLQHWLENLHQFLRTHDLSTAIPVGVTTVPLEDQANQVVGGGTQISNTENVDNSVRDVNISGIEGITSEADFLDKISGIMRSGNLSTLS